jgi:hypothetical protein
VRRVIERLVRDGTVAARSDGTVHRLFHVAVDAAEGVASLVEHHAEESQIALPRLLSEGRRFDLAFVDQSRRTLEEVSPADDLHQWAALRTSTVPDTRAFDSYVEF